MPNANHLTHLAICRTFATGRPPLIATKQSSPRHGSAILRQGGGLSNRPKTTSKLFFIRTPSRNEIMQKQESETSLGDRNKSIAVRSVTVGRMNNLFINAGVPHFVMLVSRALHVESPF